MKKKFFFSALLAAMLAGCASSDVTPTPQPEVSGQPAVAGQTPVSFSVYADRGVTRGGKEGLMDLTALQETKANGGGFGVFAYYTDLKKYDQTYVPNFMYNRGVFWKGEEGNATEDAWIYNPVMYWPNEHGSDAQSDDEDKVSFFAYAPYVQHTSPASGNVDDATSGITGFSRNSNAGDPLVKYIANFSTANTVDLCWGVCNDPSWAKIQGGSSQSMTNGLPWLDVEHPQTTSQKMKFTFKHALAQLNVQIDADADVASHNAAGDALASETKIYVRSISFTGIAMKGALNLNNTVANQALWLDYAGTTDLPYGETVTVKDGRRDGREGSSGAEATNETPAGLNPAIIQNDANNPTIGVTTAYQNLFEPAVAAAIPGQPTADEIDAALTNPVYVIPTGEAMTVTIVYDVETVSPNLAGYISDGTTHGSSVENRITKTIYYNGDGLSLESGKKYTIRLHLGMNSVKFDAAVDDWDNAAVGTNGWLPANVSAVRILNNGVQVTKMPVALSDGTLTLTGDVHPSVVTQTLTWTSSDESIATVDNGIVTFVTEGECTITATSTATGKSASCDILVTHNYANVVAPSGTLGDPGYSFGDVRKIIGADGLIYTNTTQAKEWGTNGVGIICYVGEAGSVDKSSTAADPNVATYKALALALKDANNGQVCQWSPLEVQTVQCQVRSHSLYTDLYVNDYGFTGIEDTKSLAASDGTTTLGGTGQCNGHTHAFARAGIDFKDIVDISNFPNSNWFVPSLAQWNMMLKSFAGTDTDISHISEGINPDFQAENINSLITSLGGTGVVSSGGYWSSTEDNRRPTYVEFMGGYMVYNQKKDYRFVRAVFAF